jgi:hypothetical protein
LTLLLTETKTDKTKRVLGEKVYFKTQRILKNIFNLLFCFLNIKKRS